MTYLNTGWAGPSPVSVVDAISRRLEYESYNGPTSVEVLDSGEAIDLEAREAVAGLIGASADEVLLTSSTTDGINTVMSGLPWREGDEIVTCNLEHSSILLPSYQLQRLRGVKVNVLTLAPGEAHDSILSKVEGALTDRTRMVFFSHIEYSTGLRMPMEEIRRLTAGRGIWMLIDGAQGVGHVSVDVGEIDCDFYAMPGQKWLLGPDGTGALYIRGSMIPLVEPVRVSGKWVTSYDHDGGVEPDTDNMDKFIVGTSSAPLRAGFVEGIRFVQQVGIAAIEERATMLAGMLEGAAGRHAARQGAVADGRPRPVGTGDVHRRREGPGGDGAPDVGHASHSDTRREVSRVPAGVAGFLQHGGRGRGPRGRGARPSLNGGPGRTPTGEG